MHPQEALPRSGNRYEQAIQAFLADPESDLDLVRECFWELRKEYVTCSRRFARWMIFGVSFVCLFELLNRQLVERASLSGVDITRLSFLLYLLPPLVALAFLNLWVLGVESAVYDRLIREIAKQKLFGLYQSGLASVFLARAGTFDADLPAKLISNKAKRWMEAYYTIEFFAMFLLPVAFEVYSYVQLFGHAKSFSIATLVSLCITVFLFAFALPLLVDVLSSAIEGRAA